MGLLDQLLSLRRISASKQRQETLDGFVSANRVTAMNSKGIQVGRADTTSNSAMARGVAGKLLGYVPKSMYQKVDPSSNYFFKDGSAAYKKMQEAGIGVGSSVEELQAFLHAQNKKKTPNTKNAVGHNTDKPGLNRDLNTTGPLPDVRTSDSSRQNMLDGYKTGFDQGSSNTVQDFFNLDLGVNRAYEDFQRMLHNQLFQ